MSKQVLDIEQMKHLHELGLDTSKASMQYIENNNGKILCIPKEIEHDIKDVEDGYIICDALTLQDILDILPKEIHPKDSTFSAYYLFIDYYYKQISYSEQLGYGEYKGFSFSHNNVLIDTAYEMLCWLIENGYIETNKQ